MEAVQGESAAGDGGAGGKVGGRRQFDSRHENIPSGEIAGHGDQAFDPPEARGFQREGTVRVSRGNATGAERDIPAGPAPDEVRERFGKALAAASDLQAVDRTAEEVL